MKQELLDALESSLQRMQQGEALDSVLVRFPHLAAQLRPLLETALQARSLSRADLPMRVLARQRASGVALASDLRQSKHPLRLRIWRPLMTALAVIAILVMSSNGLLTASAHSLPGDKLYPLKRTFETTQLHLAYNTVQKQALEHTFDERRVDETRSLITDQRVEAVEFNGRVTQMSATEWLVSGISVILTAQTRQDPGIRIGDEIDVDGVTNLAGGLNATHLSLVASPDDDSLQPLPSPTSSVDQNGTSQLQNNPDGSSTVPAVYGADQDRSERHGDRSSERSFEQHGSSEKTDSERSDSRSGGDN